MSSRSVPKLQRHKILTGFYWFIHCICLFQKILNGGKGENSGDKAGLKTHNICNAQRIVTGFRTVNIIAPLHSDPVNTVEISVCVTSVSYNYSHN